MTTAIANWAEQVRAGEIRAIARALSAIESQSAESEEILRQLFPFTGKAYRIGITGAPGTGKSTLVDRLATHYRGTKKTLGIIAVDPSSPFTGGAILGDRIRMQSHATDEGIYIRSMATRGFLGGLAQATGDAALLLDAAGKDIVLVETVGVGQGEVEIVRLADCTLVVLVPGMGDDVQSLKAGVMEIGDLFVINKSDHAGAERFEQQLRAVLALVPDRGGWRPPIVKTVATENQGIEALAKEIERFREHITASPDRHAREVALWRERLLQLLRTRLLESLVGGSEGKKNLEALAEQVAARKKDPYSAVSEIMRLAGQGRSR
ncbi:MAG: methylmalonyl Co-A mutase-associated GTPase MeaB [Candidatus Acidiferrales bacterium]